MPLSIYAPIKHWKRRQCPKKREIQDPPENTYQNSGTYISNDSNECHNSDAGFLNTTHSQTGGHFYSM